VLPQKSPKRFDHHYTQRNQDKWTIIVHEYIQQFRETTVHPTSSKSMYH